MHQRVLVVDDHRRNIEILERLLKNDYEVRATTSGPEALECAPSYRPDMVLLDIMMPDMDGYETCRRMREMPELAGTKIIMVSARAMVSERLEGYHAGADDYVTKPFDLDELKAKVDVYMRLRSEEEVTREIADLIATLERRAESPLSYVRDALHLLGKDERLGDENRKLVSIAEGCVTSTFNAIREIRTMASINMDEICLDPAPLQLGTALDAVVQEASWLILRRGVAVSLRRPDEVMVSGDEKQLHRAFLSLLDYLVRHTARGSDVWLQLTDGEEAEIRMEMASCSGEDPTRSPEEDAIALRIAESIVAQHRGALVVLREDGRTTGFEIRLPRAVATGGGSPRVDEILLRN